MPYANFRDLEFDRQLNRIDDLVTVELLTSSSRGSSVETDKHNTMFPSRPHTNLPRSRQQYLTTQQALLSEQPRLMPSLKVADSLSTAHAS